MSKPLTVAEQLELQVYVIQVLAEALETTMRVLRNTNSIGVALLEEPYKKMPAAVNLLVGKQPGVSVDGLGNFSMRPEIKDAIGKWLSRGARADELAAVAIPPLAK
jgi:hypothetical protein